MGLAVPQHGIANPFLLSKAEQRFDLGTDVDFVLATRQGRQEGHRWNLLDQRAVARFSQPTTLLGRLVVGWTRTAVRGRARGRAVGLESSTCPGQRRKHRQALFKIGWQAGWPHGLRSLELDSQAR